MSLAAEERYRSWIPHGFDYLDPEETSLRLSLITELRALFQGHAFHEVTPPAMDFAATFRLTEKQALRTHTFETRAREGETLAVRADLTVQIIKAVANGRLPVSQWPARFSYLQPVFQDHKWGSGARRELFQAGVELIGADGLDYPTQILGLAREAVTKAEGHLRVLYGDARFPAALLERAPAELRSPLAAAFHNKDTGELRRLAARAGLAPTLSTLLSESPLIFGDQKALDELQRLSVDLDLDAVFADARRMLDVTYDFSLTPSLSYYTGPVFEGYLPGSDVRVVSGGVYNALFREFAATDRNACGFAVELSGLAQFLRRRRNER